MKLELLDEFDKYDFQYSSAIFKLLDNNPDIMDMIFPLINLIHQKIENQIKMYISEPHMKRETFKELKIDNTHKLKDLLERKELKKYYEGIEICENYYERYKKSVIYFFEILGEDSFLNSRYPIQRNKNDVTLKKDIDYDELYEKWTEYSLASVKMALMYIAYGTSNTIIYLKNTGKIQSELDIDALIMKIIQDSFMNLRGVDLEEEVQDFFILTKEFVKRDKYFDVNYVC